MTKIGFGPKIKNILTKKLQVSNSQWRQLSVGNENK